MLCLSILLTGVIGAWLYAQTQAVFRTGIEERLLAIASVAAGQFSPEQLDPIVGPESVGSPAYVQVVTSLRRIRARAAHVRFAYILRRTEDTNQPVFVADADSLWPEIPVDLDGDGVLTAADELVVPGDAYDVSDFPEFRAAAFTRPYVDPEFTQDQWGTVVAGTAPIFSSDESNGPARYVLGVDLDVSDYLELISGLYLPFLGSVSLLLAIIAVQTLVLRRLWRTQVSQLREIDRQKDELLSIVSHQLGGPIAALRWGLEGLRDDASPALRPQLEQLMSTATGLASLTATLLDLSRVELGHLVVDKRPTEVTQLLGEILTVIDPLARAKGVTLVRDVPALAPLLLDPRLTRMSVENLLSNAVKYTPAGGTVSLRVQRSSTAMRVTVSDTGCGIPAAEQPLLFTKLFRASNVRDIVPGNGFGLYIAKGAIEQQGGTIHVHSAVGRGTTFVLDLPMEEEAIGARGRAERGRQLGAAT